MEQQFLLSKGKWCLCCLSQAEPPPCPPNCRSHRLCAAELPKEDCSSLHHYLPPLFTPPAAWIIHATRNLPLQVMSLRNAQAEAKRMNLLLWPGTGEPEKPHCHNGQHLVPFIIGKPTVFHFSQVIHPQIYHAVQGCSLETCPCNAGLFCGACKKQTDLDCGADLFFCGYTDHNSHSLFPRTIAGENMENSGKKLGLERREGCRQSVLKFDSISHYPALTWLVIN